MHKQRLIIVVAGAIGVLSAFLPWWKISILGMSGSRTGIELGDGWVSLALFAAAIALASAVGDKNLALDGNIKKVVLGLGAGAAGLMLVELMYLGLGVSASGIYLSLLAGAAVAAAPIVIKGDGSMQMPTKDSIKDELK